MFRSIQLKNVHEDVGPDELREELAVAGDLFGHVGIEYRNEKETFVY